MESEEKSTVELLSKYASKSGLLEGYLLGLSFRVPEVIENIERKHGKFDEDLSKQVNQLKDLLNFIVETI